MFTLIQKLPITTALRSPFVLSVTPVAMDKKTTRKKFKCGYAALQALKDVKLSDKHYGACVYDAEGTVVADRDFDR